MVQILHDLILGLNRVWAVRGDTLVWRRRRSLARDSLGEPVVHRHKMLHLLFPLVGANEYLSSGIACAVATTSNCTTVSCVSRTEVIVGGCVATGGGPCWARAQRKRHNQQGNRGCYPHDDPPFPMADGQVKTPSRQTPASRSVAADKR